jgi:hypothetical protein
MTATAILEAVDLDDLGVSSTFLSFPAGLRTNAPVCEKTLTNASPMSPIAPVTNVVTEVLPFMVDSVKCGTIGDHPHRPHTTRMPAVRQRCGTVITIRVGRFVRTDLNARREVKRRQTRRLPVL